MFTRLAVAVAAGLGLGACVAAETYDDAVATYLEAACTSDCRSGSEAECRAAVADELARVESTLDQTQKLRCMRCLDVKARLQPMLDACTPTAEQTATVIDACDLDPTIDSDGDGVPGDDYSEACGGHP